MSTETFHTGALLRKAYELLKTCHRPVFWIGLTMVAIPECFSSLILSLQSADLATQIQTLISQNPNPLHYEHIIEPLRPFLNSVVIVSGVQALLLLISYLAISEIISRQVQGYSFRIPEVLAAVQKRPWKIIKIFLFVCTAKIIESLFQVPFQILSVMVAIGLTWTILEPTDSPIRQMMQAVTFQYSHSIRKLHIFMVHIVFGALLFSGHTLVHYAIDGFTQADIWLDIPKNLWLLTVGETPISYIWCLTRSFQIAVETSLFCFVPFFAFAVLQTTRYTPDSLETES